MGDGKEICFLLLCVVYILYILPSLIPVDRSSLLCAFPIMNLMNILFLGRLGR